jgi:anti-sigma factor RsiW
MRCENAKRLISDGLDDSLRGSSRARLETHLAACSSCRDYEASLARVHAGCLAVAPSSPDPEQMVQSMVRLKSSLHRAVGDGVNHGLRQVHDHMDRPLWVWAAASAAVFTAVIGLYLVVLRPGPVVDIVPYAFSEAHSDFVVSLSGDDILAAAVDSALQTSLGEGGAASALPVEPLAGNAGFFLDSLTDDEVLLLDAALQEIIAL